MTEQEFTLINQRFDAMTTLMNAQFTNVNDRLDKINGKVAKHDQEITDIKSLRDKKYQQLDDYMENAEKNHAVNCPNLGAIRKLEDESLSQKSVKKFMGAMFVGGIALGGFTVALLKLILG